MSKSLEELQELAERDVGGDASGGDADGDARGGADGSTDGSTADRPSAGDAADGGSRSLLGRSPFSAKGFALTLLVLVGGLVAGSAVPIVGGLARYVGLFVAAFLLGLARSRRAYLETAVAGALAAGGAFFLGTLTSGSVLLGTNLLAEWGFSATQVGVTLGGVGVTVGVLLSLAGLYFGRDLRDGLTRDV
ncbi:hypothetical protein [Halobaculum lipolyticum]|uniref:Uncharacterized protein n=1 Tax=Halobaculum lipolyticum TaxID=3032001 RepID=A0ABD5WE98_9EURY|nr:hypothetical protein [Halobaculum sp. DT31]